MDLRKILDEYNLFIFTLNDVVKITNQKKEVVKDFLSNQIKKNRIYRLKKNYYSFIKIMNKFQIANIYSNSYIGLNSALEFYGTTTQRYNNLELISKKSAREQTINDIKIQKHKVQEKLFFGYEREIVENIDFFVSNIEKTIIDCVYFSNKVYLSETREFIRQKKEQIDLTKLSKYLKQINSKVLNKRIGYLLELEGIELKNLKINNKYEKLNNKIKNKGTKNKKWKLIINEEL